MASLFDLLKRRFAGIPSSGYSATQTPGSTPVYGYDINIGQRGKLGLDVRKNATKSASLIDKPSGLHPGVESGYQGGLTRGYLDEHGDNKGKGYWYAPTSGDPNSATMNEPPTQTTNVVGWNKPSIKGGAGGGFKRVLKHLGAMESPGPDWSLEAKKSGVSSPWSPTNVAWSPVGGTMLDWKKKRTA